jgi:hypothetical protein
MTPPRQGGFTVKVFPGKHRAVTAAVLSALINIPFAYSAQEVAPPEAQAWIDVATFSGMGMPMSGMGGGSMDSMGALGGMLGGREDMVMWSSSELADTGFGLMDYQTNPAVDRWLKEKVLLAPTTTRCTVPKGIFGENGGMLRVIAYGDELNLAHPPRPNDPKIKWEPVWAVKIRVKAVTNGFLGMKEMSGRPAAEREEETQAVPKLPQPMELLKGIFGR